MTDSWIVVVIGLVLPWLTGSAWTYWLTSQSSNWHPAAVLGHGYLLGIFTTTVIMRVFQLAGLQQSFLGTSLCLTALAAAAALMIYLKPGQSRIKHAEPRLPEWQQAAIFLLLAMIAVRYLTIFQELALRPLFPWDAWMNWAPKAVVWFHYNELVPFASQKVWLAAPAEAHTYIEGAKNAWKYPITVPLVQLWGMLVLNSSDNSMIYLPWICIALASGSALYGHLKLASVHSLLAIAAVYTYLNIPFINVHSALAGYADLWVTVAFGAGIFALAEWARNRQWPYLLLALIMAIFCSQLKIPGLIMGAIVIAAFLLTLFPLRKRLWLALFIAASLGLLSLYFVGINATLPYVGEITVSRSAIVVPYIGAFDVAYHDVTDAVIETMFLMINWNLLWYIFLASTLAIVLTPEVLKNHRPEFFALVTTLGFLYFVYYFTERFMFAEDFTQINRALMYSTPVAVFLMAGALNTFLKLRQTQNHSLS
ncbi:MAG: hypothetical protein ABJN62_13205 [Halioglobus sp.]